MKGSHILLHPTAIARSLGALAFLLVLASVGGQLMTYLMGHDHIYGLVKLFYLDEERNIPTSFSTLLLLFASLLLAVIMGLEKQQAESRLIYWAILSFGFLFMAADEVLSIHERWTEPVRELLGNGNLGIFYYAWVIPYFILILILVPLFLRFLIRLPTKTKFAFVIAGAIYIAGSMGVELIGGYYAEMHGRFNLTYSMIVTVEESLEMGGVILFIWALLSYISDNYKEVQFRIEDVPRKVVIEKQSRRLRLAKS
ncbi:MAG: hypothetical protein ACPGYT_14255 [Nitrospirales bacterium]